MGLRSAPQPAPMPLESGLARTAVAFRSPRCDPFSEVDVVRHPLMQEVVKAYDVFDAKKRRLDRLRRPKTYPIHIDDGAPDPSRAPTRRADEIEVAVE